jgi:oxygen-independent coproporphyrinogen-3 oxidase
VSPVAVYVHVPFCPSKCGYCDFNSYALSGEIVPQTVAAMLSQIETSPFAGVPAKTIFFGGGTPTFLDEASLMSILEAVMRVHPPVENCEITSEANPGTVDASKFRAMRAGGFNRISLGAQSFLDSDLIALERVHKGGDIERAFFAAREAGFDNVNLDLMFALPNQTRRGWTANLERALAMEPDHLSLYCLTIEPNTAFYRRHLRGELHLPDDDAQVAMYDECVEKTAEKGYEAYEISNFAKPGRACQHNLEYWHAAPYLAYGPGAVGCLSDGLAKMAGRNGSIRYTNHKQPRLYVEKMAIGSTTWLEEEALTPETHEVERLMLGLRLAEGVELAERDENVLRKLIDRQWIDLSGQRVTLTAEGRHFCSEVALELAMTG